MTAPSTGWSVWSSWGPCNQANCYQTRERYCFDKDNAGAYCFLAIERMQANRTSDMVETQRRKCKEGGRCAGMGNLNFIQSVRILKLSIIFIYCTYEGTCVCVLVTVLFGTKYLGRQLQIFENFTIHFHLLNTPN